MAGINDSQSEPAPLSGGLRWRETDDISVQADLFDAQFDVEMSSFIAEIGTRFRF